MRPVQEFEQLIKRIPSMHSISSHDWIRAINPIEKRLRELFPSTPQWDISWMVLYYGHFNP